MSPWKQFTGWLAGHDVDFRRLSESQLHALMVVWMETG